ncbi:hypothetical protein O181_000717 [Austropuccinia psidii MF-1]|uniref:GH18 domain-containing protein n=1 Tax=Austropuccinia psidii MF-1 TaxID=1389203 RepID=A0A9Q3B968_9BASI|nr:hypothetical protein [Austropuccinia psidii MF-1]
MQKRVGFQKTAFAPGTLVLVACVLLVIQPITCESNSTAEISVQPMSCVSNSTAEPNPQSNPSVSTLTSDPNSQGVIFGESSSSSQNSTEPVMSWNSTQESNNQGMTTGSDVASENNTQAMSGSSNLTSETTQPMSNTSDLTSQNNQTMIDFSNSTSTNGTSGTVENSNAESANNSGAIILDSFKSAANRKTNVSFAVYYPGYHATLLPPEQIPWDLYTHMDYFVATTGSEPGDALKIENEENLKAVVSGAKSHQVSISLSIGGWTGSQYISKLVSNKASRSQFAKVIMSVVQKYDLNGIDIDWEYPNVPGQDGNILSKDDSENLLKFLQVLRKTLGPQARLSAAVSVHGFMGPDGNYLKDHKPYAEFLDFITIMAYDIYTPSSGELVGPNAPLFDACNDPKTKYSADQAVRTWTSTGFPASKILLGLAAYGHQYKMPNSQLTKSNFSGNATSFLFTEFDKGAAQQSPFTAQPQRPQPGPSTCGGPEENNWLYKDLINCGVLSADAKEGKGGFIRHYDNCSETPFLFNPTTKVLISYDDAESLAKKANYARSKGLAGINVFDATGDTQNHTLFRAIKAQLN